MNCPIIDTLSKEERELFFASAKEATIPKGTILFFQGDVCSSILYITRGSVKVYVQNEEGEEITLYLLESGEQCIVNTSSVISASPAVGSAVALSDVSGYLLDGDVVKKLMVSSQNYQNFMFSLFSLRLRGLAELVEDIKFRPLEQRLMKWLNSKESQKIETTHEKIAEHLGSSRVVISRLLKKLERDGVLELSRNSIVIKGQKCVS